MEHQLVEMFYKGTFFFLCRLIFLQFSCPCEIHLKVVKVCENIKMFKFLNQCFAQLRFWKSVSDSQNLLDGATAVLLETLFQNRSRAKH